MLKKTREQTHPGGAAGSTVNGIREFNTLKRSRRTKGQLLGRREEVPRMAEGPCTRFKLFLTGQWAG